MGSGGVEADVRARLTASEGQSTVEWTALVALVALLFVATLAALGASFPGAALARTIAAKMICAADPAAGACDAPRSDELETAYGTEVATQLRASAPQIRYEGLDPHVPVDFRSCRKQGCARARRNSPRLTHNVKGEPATSFTHVVDCRTPESPIPPEANCSGDAAGSLYLQYWLYYPDSYTKPFGEAGYHPDDWESYQVRVGPDGVFDRASSHRSYDQEGRVAGWLADAGLRKRAGWGPRSGYVWVSEGSHAGRRSDDGNFIFSTPASALRLIPIETAIYELDSHAFKASPAWRKDVYLDPESSGTSGNRDPLPNAGR